MNIRIRPYQHSDRRTIEKLFEDFQDYIISIDPIKRLRRAQGYSEHTLHKTIIDIKKKNGIFLLAEHNSVIVGFLVSVIIKQEKDELFSIIPSTIGRITELYVVPEYRRQTVGSQLIQLAETYLRQQSCDVIFIEVFIPNTSAHAFYKRHNYHDRTVDLIKKLS